MNGLFKTRRPPVGPALPVCAAAFLTPMVALAAPPALTMTWTASSDPSTPTTVSFADDGSWAEAEDGSTVFTGSLFDPHWQLSWTAVASPDAHPSLDLLLSITNTSPGSQTFASDVLLGQWFATSSDSILAAAASLSVMNLQFSGGASLETEGDVPLLSWSLDGESRAALFAPIYGLTAFGPFSTSTDSAATSSEVDAAGSWRSISHFTVSAGDTATIHTTTSLTTIPAPATLAAIAAIAVRPRRRRHP
jgi:hypothetical protein